MRALEIGSGAQLQLTAILRMRSHAKTEHLSDFMGMRRLLLDGLCRLELLDCRGMGHVTAEFVTECCRVVRVDLRFMRATCDGDEGHAVVEQVFRSQFSIRVDQHPVGGLPVAGMARDRAPALPFPVKAAANPLRASFSPFPSHG